MNRRVYDRTNAASIRGLTVRRAHDDTEGFITSFSDSGVSVRITKSDGRRIEWGAGTVDITYGELNDCFEVLGDTVETCGIKRVREPDDMISGHVEYATVTLCGEDTCSDECWQGWAFCPYCGRPMEKRN